MHPKYILISDAKTPRIGTFVYGMVGLHEELRDRFEKTHGYGKMHGGGWYRKDDEKRTMTLFGQSGDFGPANLLFLNRIPAELKGYTFYYSPGGNLPPNQLDLQDVEWF